MELLGASLLGLFRILFSKDMLYTIKIIMANYKSNKGRCKDLNHKRTQKKSEPQMGLEPTTLRVLDRML